MASNVVKKLPRVKCKDYSVCMLYNKKIAEDKLRDVTIATCNVLNDTAQFADYSDSEKDVSSVEYKSPTLKISDKMHCNCCECSFEDRKEQEQHYKSDWHRYNLRLKLGDFKYINIEDFEKIANDVSSISGSEDEDEKTSDDEGLSQSKAKVNLTLPAHVKSSANVSCSSDSESESIVKKGRISAPQLNKLYLRSKDGELLSVYKCLLYHKKCRLTEQPDLIREVHKLTARVNSAIFMSAGGHFAGAIYNGNEVIAHKTFHRYVVRAKRGTAQGTRDSQGNAPKSAGASLRRYNEAALTQEIQDWINSYTEQINNCHFLFLRAPSFNRKIFYGGKNPPFKKDDLRIRIIPFPTRRPTYNEVKRVHEMLSSIECYGAECDLQNVIPISPMRQLSCETGQLEIVPDSIIDSQLPKKHTRHLASSKDKETKEIKEKKKKERSQLNPDNIKLLIPDHVLGDEDSTCSESELFEIETIISTEHLKEFDCVKVPRKKSPTKRRKAPSKHQVEPEEDIYAEERYHLQNALYTACKTGDSHTLSALLAVFHGTDITPCVLTPANLSQTNRVPSPDSSNQATFVDTTLADKTDNKNNGATDKYDIDRTTEITNVNKEPNNIPSELKNSDKTTDVPVKPENRTLTVPNSLSLKSQSMRFGGYTLDQLSPLVTVDVLNKPFGDNSTTYLHVAARANHKKILTMLMKYGADPSAKDKNGCVPYAVSDTKDTKNEFRRFMAIYPNKYDYQKAQIPGPLTAEKEEERKLKEAERKQKQKKAKAEKMKVQREENSKRLAEENEKKRFLGLSDREKRLLAAERRLINQHDRQGSNVPVLSRCYNCAVDISGRVPFEYADYKFCTTKCLREHRNKS